MTLTTVGYGDVTPVNMVEYMVVTFMMISGGFLWAYIIGGLCSLVSNMNLDKLEFQQDYDRINDMMSDMNLDNTHRTEIRSYLFQCEASRKRESYKEIITQLSDTQKKELAKFQATVDLSEITIFSNLSENFILKLYTRLDRAVYAPREFLDKPRTMYIVSSGLVLKSGFMYTKGSVLGKDFILDSLDLVAHTHTHTHAHTH